LLKVKTKKMGYWVLMPSVNQGRERCGSAIADPDRSSRNLSAEIVLAMDHLFPVDVLVRNEDVFSKGRAKNRRKKKNLQWEYIFGQDTSFVAAFSAG